MSRNYFLAPDFRSFYAGFRIAAIMSNRHKNRHKNR